MIYIILALLFYTVANLASAAASRNTDSNLVTAIVNTVSAIIPIAVIIPHLSKKLIVDGKTGIILAVVVGIAVALFTMLLNKSYSVNKVAIVAPIVFGGSIFLTSILSFIIFKEKFSLAQGIGLVLLAFGLIFIIYAKATGN